MKEHGNFSTKAEYDAIPDVPDNPSAVLAGEPKFMAEEYGGSRRTTEVITNPEQAMAEAYAAKPYMDAATEIYEQYKKEDPESYEENWKDIDGLEALIALGRDASTEAGKKWQTMSPDERLATPFDKLDTKNKPFLDYMNSSIQLSKALDNIPEDILGRTHNPDDPLMNGMMNKLHDKLKSAKTAAERSGILKDISVMESFADREQEEYIHEPANSYAFARGTLEQSSSDETSIEGFKNKTQFMNEQKQRNLRDARAYELVKTYAESEFKTTVPIVEKTGSRLNEDEMRRQMELVNKLKVSGSRQASTKTAESQPQKPESEKTQEKSMVPDDPRERMKFEREFFVAKNMTPENVPVLVDYLKKVLLSSANEVTNMQQERGSPNIKYPGMLATLTGRTVDYMYEDRVGVATFLFDTVKDKIKLKSGEPIKYTDFSTLGIDYIFDRLGLDVREIVPDYDDKFAS